MLYSTAPTQCSFDTTVNCLNKLGNCYTRDKDLGCSDFGGWLTSAPRKRKNKMKEISPSVDGETKQKSDKNQMKLLKPDTYYKRYRVDPLEGTFKHYKNSAQYMQLYRETTTLCYKQRTLQELTAMYSAALDINSRVIQRRLAKVDKCGRGDSDSPYSIPEVMPLPKIGFTPHDVVEVLSDRGHTLSGYTYNLDLDSFGKWELQHATSQHDVLTTNAINIPPITSRSESGIPLMLIPTAPSIPTRLNHQAIIPSPIAQASFMCNAYMNRSIVCPVHRVIHRRSCVISNSGRSRNNLDSSCVTGHIDEQHIKVTLPGIPKRSSQVLIQPNSKGATPNSSHYLQDEEEEESVDVRINNLLSANNHSSPSERISKALQQQKRPIPSMQLPVTALLQYSPANLDTPPRPAKIKKHLTLKTRVNKLTGNKKQGDMPKPDIKQLNYEQEYEKFFSDVLESKGRNSQRKHFQNMSSKL